jgi:hypothetical protein
MLGIEKDHRNNRSHYLGMNLKGGFRPSGETPRYDHRAAGF